MCMGCGVSKFDHEEASPTFKRPTKRHSNVENDGTLASDRLLHEYGRKSNNDRKNVSSLTSGKWEPDARDQVNEKNEGDNAYPGFDRKFKVTAEEEKRGGDGGGDYNSSEKDKNEEENESFSDRGDDIALPGSPSFREYCVYPREDFNEDEGLFYLFNLGNVN